MRSEPRSTPRRYSADQESSREAWLTQGALPRSRAAPPAPAARARCRRPERPRGNRLAPRTTRGSRRPRRRRPAVGGGDGDERVGDRPREVVALAECGGERQRLGVLAEHEERERARRSGRSATPRPRRRRRAPSARPGKRRRRRGGAPSSRRSAGPTSRRAHPPPSSRGSARRRCRSHSRDVVACPAIREAEPGGPRAVRKLRQLALVGVARLAAAVARDRLLRPVGPVHARKSRAA